MENNKVTLKEALNTKTLKAKVSVSSWEQAVEQVGNLMVGAGLVEEKYIEGMKNTLRELGPYSVIAPGIAMPHARPEDGVLEPGFALITLKDPVEFGSQANDPVDIVIAFAAEDKISHVDALREIAELFSDEEAVAQIRAAITSKQLVEIFQERNG